jgi:hypothetical protein
MGRCRDRFVDHGPSRRCQPGLFAGRALYRLVRVLNERTVFIVIPSNGGPERLVAEGPPRPVSISGRVNPLEAGQ